MILLLNPPSPPNAIANREGTVGYGTLSPTFAYPPHILATVAAACRQAEQPVQILDAVAEKLDIDACLSRVRSSNPALLGVLSSWGTRKADGTALRALRPAFPDLPIVALGPGVRPIAGDLIAAGATHVLYGDPELAFATLATTDPLPPPGILGAHDLLPQLHNHAGLLRHPDRLPRPAWDLVPWQRYGFLTIHTSRGCDDHCKFCAYVVAQGRAFRPRPPADVVDEMLWLARTFQPRRIIVRDPVFARDRARALAIGRRLGAARFRTSWECESRPEDFDPTLLKALAGGCCRVIKLGLETTDPELLAAIARIDYPFEASHYLAYAHHIVKAAHRLGIRTRVFVLAGLPGQTVAHAEATAAYLRQLQPTFVHARPYIPYPGVTLGPAQDDPQIAAILAPLQAVAEERLALANRSPSLLRRLLQKLAGT